MWVWVFHLTGKDIIERSTDMSFDIYAEVTNQIVAMLDQGVVPWRSPILGRSSAGHPKNLKREEVPGR